MSQPAQKTVTPGTAEQIVVVRNGNELAATAANHINFHVMGYFPITPSTAVAEELDAMKAAGEHDVHMIPGDGEHGAAGICFGATTTGARVFNCTAANGLLYAIEQLPVQSGSRFPMLLNVVNRAVSGPLNIRGDHSDLVYTLSTGWLTFLAKDPQMVYDMNIIALKVAEHPDVRLPAIVSFDGFFTSHQKRRVYIFKDRDPVQKFLGPNRPVYTAIDPDNPVTIGPYMNDDLINNRKQQALAMDKAADIIPVVFKEYAELSGRSYDIIHSYRMEDAEAALFILNSSYDTACEAVDILRNQGHKVGVLSLTVLRPFPKQRIQDEFRNVKALCVGDRQDTYGTGGGSMSLEIKAALKDDTSNKTLIFSRIYGIGGNELYLEEVIEMFKETIAVAKKGQIDTPYEYVGAYEGDEGFKPEPAAPVLSVQEQTPGIIKVDVDEETGKLKVKGVNSRKLTEMPKRLAAGHGACPGCGIIPTLNNFLRGIEGPVVVLFHTGCGMIIGSGYPFSAHRVTYIHNLFQNGAATMSGVVDAFLERQRRGEIPDDRKITFIHVTGDGGNDIGMGPSIGAALRGHHMIQLEYDNEGYMNTGNQLSFSTPMGHATSTSHVGPAQAGKSSFHKDTAQIMAACHLPYVFTGCECQHADLTRKAAKAQYYAEKHGFVYGKILSFCPLNWRCRENDARKILQAAVDSCFFPLYEVENGVTAITYDPEAKKKRIPLLDWLQLMGKTKHFTKPAYEELLKKSEAEVERRWQRLKAMNDSPVL